MLDFQVVILAGGLATRLGQVAEKTPKILVPVAGKPFIEHQFDLLRRSGLNNILLCIGHMGDQVVSYVGDGSSFEMRVQYAQDPKNVSLGTGGALFNAWNLLDSHFLVIYGDSYLRFPFESFIEWYQAKGLEAAMSVYKNLGHWDKSNCRVDAGQVSFYSKKATPEEVDHIDYGASLFSKEVLKPFRDRPYPLDLGEIQEQLAQEGMMGAYEATNRFFEIGRPESLQELEQWLKESSL